jgi:hypothetical protein
MKDLLSLVKDDWHLISIAFIFLLAAAASQVSHNLHHHETHSCG